MDNDFMQFDPINLPDYSRPPVIEVVCGLQFQELKGLDNLKQALFYNHVRDDYPKAEQHPPLGETFERYEDSTPNESVRIEFRPNPVLPRFFFIDDTSNWLIQMQSNRFLYNWRKMNDDDVYPHFPEINNRLNSVWDIFVTFCSQEMIDTPQVNQLELTYVNHILSGAAWESLGDIGTVFNDLSWSDSHRFLPQPESLIWRCNFLLPNQMGRLHVLLRNAKNKSDDTPVLLCELTVRGVPEETTLKGINEWFELGREWIVRGFADLITESIQNRIFERKQ